MHGTGPQRQHPRAKDHRWLLRLIAVLVAAAAALNAVKFSGFFHDDALISLRYARNLSEFGELAWNPGEPVEGYTNPLHVLLTSALIRVGFDGLVATRVVNAAGLVALWAFVWRLTSGLPSPARLAGLSTVVGAPVFAWTWGGLEAVPAAALVAGAFLAAIRASEPGGRLALSVLASFVFGLAYLVRPGTLVINLATGIAILAFAEQPLRRRVLHFLALGSVSGLILALHLAIRLKVYGLWLPLTYYAKVGVDPVTRLLAGGTYTLSAALELPALILVGALALALRGREATAEQVRIRRLARIATLTLALFLAYVAWSGGDHMFFSRILVPATPLIAAALAAQFTLLPRPAITAGALALAGLAAGEAALRPTEDADEAAAVGAVIGRYLAANYPPGTTVALATAGSTPYFASMHRYIDTLGLNDPVIARRDPVPRLALLQHLPGHAKGDGAYVLSRKPDIIILGLASGLTYPRPLFLTEAELTVDPEFARCYAKKTTALDPPFDIPFDAPPVRKPVIFIRYERVC